MMGRQNLFRAFHRFSHSGSYLANKATSIAKLYLLAAKNHTYDYSINGEFYVLDKLAKHPIKTVFDVGANVGDYSIACARKFPLSNIYAFEIVPATAQKFEANTKGSSRIHLNKFGLSNSNGELTINYNPDHDVLSSLVAVSSHSHLSNWTQITVPVKTGDEYCVSNGIDHIDLLKVDVEGAEQQVFAGFQRMFSERRVSVVQLEYGLVNVDTKYLRKDIWSFFEENGFTIGPIMPKGVDFRKYSYYDEEFIGPPNFLAVHCSAPQITRDLTLRS